MKAHVVLKILTQTNLSISFWPILNRASAVWCLPSSQVGGFYENLFVFIGGDARQSRTGN